MITACFFLFCWFAQDAVPDGAGGYVPFTNSRVMPDGSLRPYDPAFDGIPGGALGGPFPSVVPMLGLAVPGFAGEPPPDYAYPEGYAGQGQAYLPPPYSAPRRHKAGPPTHDPCYDANGKFVGADNSACR